MAFQQIETGYKPEFALGALYQGYNAGNAMNENALSQLKAEEALQKSRLTDPNDVLRSMFEGQVDAAKLNDPEFIQKQLAGYKGQMNTQIAAGNKAMELSADDIKASRRDLQNKYMTGELDARTYAQQSKMFDQIEAGTYQGNQQPASAPIGFGFQPQNYGNEGRGVPGPQSPNNTLAILNQIESGNRDFNPDGSPMRSPKGALFARQVLPATAADPGFGISPATSQTPAEYNRVGEELFGKMITRYGGDTLKGLAAYNMGSGAFDSVLSKYGSDWRNHLPEETTKYLTKAESLGASGSSKESTSLTSRFSQGSQPTPFTNLIPQSGALAQMAGVRALSPELVGKMAQGEQKNNYAESLLTTKLASAENIARAKAQFQQNPKTAEAVMAQILDKQRRGMPLSSDDVEVFNTASEVLQAKVPVNVNTQMNPNVAPNVFKGGEVRPSMPQIGQPKTQQQEPQKKPTKPLSEF